MKGSKVAVWAGCLLATLAMGCGSQPSQQVQARSAEQGATAAAKPPAVPGDNRQAEFGHFPDRAFTRLNLAKLQWRPTEGNTLGVQTAVLEGDPSKPGFYLTINKFPPEVMSRPHTHPDERHCIVIRGTSYTGEGKDWTPEKTVGLKPGDYMRHPSGGLHYDGALDEEVLIAISGYGPTRADVLDRGELFGRSRPAK
jgi:ChrR-like protein with cupin domain